MGSNGQGPRPWTARYAQTLFVRVPKADWPLVKRGLKREFRGTPGNQSALWMTEPPVPVLAYTMERASYRQQTAYDARLMVLERVWREELAAISDESLANEGFDSFEAFRRAWMRRYRDGKKFRPTQVVF